jgi:hypothetical protein
MRSSKEIRSEMENLKIRIREEFSDEDINRYVSLRNRLKKAKVSERFRVYLLDRFLNKEYVLECIEKGSESFYIKLSNGRNYVYYVTKEKLKEFVKDGRNITIDLGIYDFLFFFDFLITDPKKIIEGIEFYQELKNEYTVDEDLRDYAKNVMGHQMYRSGFIDGKYLFGEYNFEEDY